MAQRNITPEEAARILGVDQAKLDEFRQQGLIEGQEEDGEWKVRPTDLHRAAAELGVTLPPDVAETSASEELLSEELNNLASDEDRTTVGQVADEGNDDVQIRSPQDSEVLSGSDIDETESAARTRIGMGESDSAIDIQGGSEIGPGMGHVIDEDLSAGDDDEMRTELTSSEKLEEGSEGAPIRVREEGHSAVMDELAGGSDAGDESGTMVGSPSDEGEVNIEQPSEDAAVLGDELDVDHDDEMGTVVGSSQPKESPEEVMLQGGSSVNIEKDSEASELLSDELGQVGDEQQTIVGASEPKETEPEEVMLQGGSSLDIKKDEVSDVLSDDLDAVGDQNQTMVGKSDEVAGGPVEIKSDDSGAAGLLDDELSAVGEGEDDRTVVGRQEEMKSDIVPLGTDSEIFSSESASDAAKTQIGSPGMMEDQIELETRDDRGDVHPGMQEGEESDVRMVAGGMTPPDSDIKLNPLTADSDLDIASRLDEDFTAALESASEEIGLDPLETQDDSEMSISLELDDEELAEQEAADEPPVQDDVAESVSETIDATTSPAGADDLTVDMPNEVLEEEISLEGETDAGGSDLAISESDVGLGGSGTSDIMLDEGTSLGSGASMVNLEEEDDEDEFVLGGSDGSDVTLQPDGSGIGIGTSESGIALSGIADSGISLESGVDLAGSSVGSGASAGASDAFNLQPHVDPDDASSEDSGSQVIALDQDAEFDDGAATMLGPEAEPMGVGVSGPAISGPRLDAPAASYPSSPQVSPAAGVMPAPAQQQQQVVYTEPLTYSVWNIVSLAFCMLVMVFCALMLYDLVAVNMWEWQGLSESQVHNNEKIMDFVLDLIKL